ncbi:MAG: cytochrome b/b6 [Rickettsiales bacterium]
MKKIIDWIDYRLPIFSFINELKLYKTPKNLNYFWNLGSIALIGLIIQIITGIILACHYIPHVEHAHQSVERIMRDVQYGWLVRYIHSVGASMFFISVYLHMFKSILYGSYKYPRELLWQLGVIIFIIMMATAFMGYVLPWGQMSYWGATVITNIFSAIPIIGEDIVIWIWGGYSVANPTLNRFFSLHYLLPFIMVFIVFLHLVALKRHGANNPTGVELEKKDQIPFHPYYTIKDIFGFGIYFTIFAFFVFFEPNYLGHPDNYVPANPLVTPAHIVPEWYFLPFYAILRSVPYKFGGAIAMFGSVLILLFLPFLDRSNIKSYINRPIYKYFIFIFTINFVLLGYLGSKEATEGYILISKFCTIYYFMHFLIITPVVSYYEIKHCNEK